MKRFIFLLSSYVFFFSPFAYSNKLALPNQMDQTERREILQIIGPATSSRLLSSPYPLGGWEGFEIGLSRQSIPMSYISDIDPSVALQKDFEYPVLTVGKGLYYNFDLFLSMVPMIESESINHFSTQLRYQFWNSANQSFRLSSLLYVGATTLNNQINMQSYGFDLLGTLTIDRISLFLGLGTSFNNGHFIGGSKGITATQKTEVETLTIPHQLLGLEWPLGNFFLVAEVDRFKIPYYTVKLGYRR